MRIGAIAEGLRDRATVLLGIGRRPLLETHGTLILAQALMVAAKVGLFEALSFSALTPAQVALRCGTDARATAKLLCVLEATAYVRTVAGGEPATRTRRSPDRRCEDGRGDRGTDVASCPTEDLNGYHLQQSRRGPGQEER